MGCIQACRRNWEAEFGSENSSNPGEEHKKTSLGKICCNFAVWGVAAVVVGLVAIALGALSFTGVLPFGITTGFWLMVGGSIFTLLSLSVLACKSGHHSPEPSEL